MLISLNWWRNKVFFFWWFWCFVGVDDIDVVKYGCGMCNGGSCGGSCYGLVEIL